MYIKKHRSGTGWVYQFAVPRSLQKLLGKTQFHGYIAGRQDRNGEREAQAAAIERARKDAAAIEDLKTLPEPDREAFIASGGLEAVRKGLPELEAIHALFANMRPESLARDDGYYAHLEGFQPRDAGTRAIITLGMQDHAREVLAPKLALHRDLVAKADGIKPRQLGNCMMDVFDLWVKKKGPKVARGHKRTCERWIAVMGDTPVKSITRKMVQAFYDKNEAEALGRAAQMKHRDHLKTLLELALREDWIESNPAAKVTLSAAVTKKVTGADDSYRAFTPAQLADILAKAKVTWGADDEKTLALRTLVFSGARANEICQLRCSDIETIDGVSVMRIPEGLGQSVKNAPSARLVPLHPAIASDVLAQSGNGSEWLFPSFPHDNPAGHAETLRDAFNGRFDKKKDRFFGLLRGVCGIVDPALVLHGCRHSFIDACRRAGISEDIERRLVGHGKPDVHARYGRGAGLVAMAAALASVDPLNG